jgi:hypothetical protein
MAAGGALDQPLETRPETRLLQRPVEPAGRDAEVSLVRRYVVNAVVAPRQVRVRVRLAVDLVDDASRLVG